MSDFAPHPDDEILRLFAVGRLTERQGDEIEKHLADCEACTRRLDEIERKKNDSVLDAMKAAAINVDADWSDDEFSPGMKVGSFRLEERLGRGGMGEAWKSWDETAQRHIVLKFVPKDIQHLDEAMNAVLDSFQKVHALQHSHICPLYMIDNDPEYGFFVVMKFIDGLPLNAYSRQHGPLPFDETVQILRDVADALDYAHSRKVVHRDVKPANIMVGSADGVQLIDFGLADEIRASLTRTENVSVHKMSGTRSYMAPEQWQGRKQDARTDQYALAVTAYELLAGHVPFSGDDTEVLKNAVLHDPPAPIPDLPEHVNAALFRGLAKNRNDRYENCLGFVEALGKPVETKAVPWKWIAAALIASALILFAAVYFSTRQPLKPPVEPNPNDPVQKTEPVTVKVSVPSEKSIIPPVIGPDRNLERQFETVFVDERSPGPSAFIQPERPVGVYRTIRVTVEIDAKANGRMTVRRGFSREQLPGFRGTPFDTNSFENAVAYRGQNGMSRILFPKGDTSLKQTSSNFSLQKTKPFGWEQWISGDSHENRHGGLTRFQSLRVGDRAGVSLAKAGQLPCAITFEVVDNDDNLPYLELVLYQDWMQKIKVCTISCWGDKDKDGRLRINAAFSCEFMPGGQTFIAENAPVEQNSLLSRVFQLPPVIAASNSNRVETIQFGLFAQNQPSMPTHRTGFDLTFLDLVGRFKGDAGLSLEDRGTKSVIVRVDPHGPAWRLLKGAEIQSINDQIGSTAKLREILDSLHFGDPVTVRYIPMGGGGSITSLFTAE